MVFDTNNSIWKQQQVKTDAEYEREDEDAMYDSYSDMKQEQADVKESTRDIKRIFSSRLHELFAEKKEEHRKKNGRPLTKAQLAKDLIPDEPEPSTRKSRLDNWMRKNTDRISIPDIVTLKRIADYFDCDLEYLIDEAAPRRAASQTVEQITGLTPAAVYALRRSEPEVIHVISALLEQAEPGHDFQNNEPTTTDLLNRIHNYFTQSYLVQLIQQAERTPDNKTLIDIAYMDATMNRDVTRYHVDQDASILLKNVSDTYAETYLFMNTYFRRCKNKTIAISEKGVSVI